ncbi:thioredoxin [Sinomonas sp. JGH33]|uniref:Thioredoxin n=1 Tax=Sinomonas terricola TaxID=3110330 RepID=A0ABU5T2K7_9MICC|nr:thioredoxin [Sinomonas sp. JGH33]MEA5453719.1 thioredoxin [Sinomonas sp. JGH33]
MSAIKHVPDETFESHVLESEKPVLVDFWAEWCAPCRVLGPILEQIHEEHDEIEIVKINIDENPAITRSYGITSIPTMKLYKGGEVEKTIIGAMSKTHLEQEMGSFLRKANKNGI